MITIAAWSSLWKSGSIWLIRLSVIHMQIILCTVWSHILTLSTRDCECKIKMNKNSLDGSVFAIIFPLAKHAGVGVRSCNGTPTS